jgi:N-acetylmuramoyl-L-alanine amidase
MINHSKMRIGMVLAWALILIALPLSLSNASSAEELATSGVAEAGDIAKMVGARIVGDADRTRFVADLSETVEIGLFTLADPYRVVLDLPQIGFSLPDGIGQTGRGMVSAFRYGQISPGKSRIVLDVSGPVRVDRSYVLPSVEDQPARLVIDVVPATRSEFLEINRQYRDAEGAEAMAKQNRELVPRSNDEHERILIVIDPGHGGIDSGATGSTGALEKDIALKFAKVLGAKLESTGLYDIHYTREDDSFVGLGERVTIAQSHGAELFLSIHANSFSSRKIRGTMIYTVSDEASDKMAAEIAASENQSDILAGHDIDEVDSDGVMDILIDLMRRETRNFGIVFANNLVRELGATTRMFKVPHQQAGFKVLEAPDVPSAMVELGYLSNASDEKQLLSPEWRDKAADSIVKAIAGYFSAKPVHKAER